MEHRWVVWCVIVGLLLPACGSTRSDRGIPRPDDRYTRVGDTVALTVLCAIGAVALWFGFKAWLRGDLDDDDDLIP